MCPPTTLAWGFYHRCWNLISCRPIIQVRRCRWTCLHVCSIARNLIVIIDLIQDSCLSRCSAFRQMVLSSTTANIILVVLSTRKQCCLTTHFHRPGSWKTSLYVAVWDLHGLGSWNQRLYGFQMEATWRVIISSCILHRHAPFHGWDWLRTKVRWLICNLWGFLSIKIHQALPLFL